jgi:hypothetical protein
MHVRKEKHLLSGANGGWKILVSKLSLIICAKLGSSSAKRSFIF